MSSQPHRVQRHRSSSGLLAAACLLYSGSALNVGTRGPGATAGTQHLSAPALQVLTVSSGPVSVVGRDQALQQAPSSARPWADALQASLVAALAGSLLVSGSPAWAENELADLANSKSTSELVDPQCFADKCSVQTKACIDNPDCTKGLVCTAKCMGDAQCTVGCFARFGNPDLDQVLSCTIEDAACIKIALMAPGADGPLDAPLPRHGAVGAQPEVVLQEERLGEQAAEEARGDEDLGALLLGDGAHDEERCGRRLLARRVARLPVRPRLRVEAHHLRR